MLLFSTILFQLTIYSNEIAHCQLSQSYGTDTIFINQQNESITEFDVDYNYTFGIILGSKFNFNNVLTLNCIDLTSTVCSDYIGPCPQSIFIIRFVPKFITVVNFQEATSYFRFQDNQVLFVLQFVDLSRLIE